MVLLLSVWYPASSGNISSVYLDLIWHFYAPTFGGVGGGVHIDLPLSIRLSVGFFVSHVTQNT